MSSSTPRRDRLRSFLWLSILSSAIAVGACNSSRDAVDDSAPTDTPAEMTDGSAPISTGPSIGERLGRLDAQMQTAPPDSLDALRAEYDRLLAEAARLKSNEYQTGGVDQIPDSLAGSRTADGTVEPQGDSNPLDPETSDDQLASDGTDTPIENDPPVSHELVDNTTSPYDTIIDPTRSFRGLRASEIAYMRGEPIPSTARVSSNDRLASSERVASPTRSGARLSGGTGTARSSEAVTSSSSSDGSERDIAEGLAAARAGNYPKAAEKISSGSKSAVAKRPAVGYTLAQSQERSGNLSKAAENYKKLSGSKSTTSHQSYLAYCRVLGKMGQRAKARQMVLRFIQQNPKSSEVVNARRLLQTM